MKTRLFLSLMLLFSAIPCLSAEKPKAIVYPDWTNTCNGNSMTMVANDGTEYTVPLSLLTGPFSFSFINRDQRFIFKTGFEGLGFITTLVEDEGITKKAIVTQENPEWIQIYESCTTDFEADKLTFLTRSNHIVNLNFLYAYLEGETHEGKTLSAYAQKTAREVIEEFFNGSLSLETCSYFEAYGYRPQHIFGRKDLFFLLRAPIISK